MFSTRPILKNRDNFSLIETLTQIVFTFFFIFRWLQTNVDCHQSRIVFSFGCQNSPIDFPSSCHENTRSVFSPVNLLNHFLSFLQENKANLNITTIHIVLTLYNSFVLLINIIHNLISRKLENIQLFQRFLLGTNGDVLIQVFSSWCFWSFLSHDVVKRRSKWLYLLKKISLIDM